MKFSLSWLKTHLETDADVHKVTDCLNRIGLEVEGVENPADALRAFRIAKVVKAAKHPGAEKLQVLIVDAGDGPVQVVCGAPNARAGMTGIFGPAGAIVPANGMELKVTAIRGEQSNGMMCSLYELGLGDDHDGIAELSGDAPKGSVYAEWAGLDDSIIDVSITPNRQDCMGVYGIARDLAAAGLGTLKPLKAPVVAGNFPCPTEIRVEDHEGCPAFFGRVIKGVTNGASPDWMQARLKSAGQKPISALVDITNYVMLDHGRPAHVYDLARLQGAVTARRAKEGEALTALNGKDYTLTSAMTVIADDAGVHDIAGIMGGEHSGCSDATRDVLIEVAYFDPERIAKTGQALSLTSDARARFERGVDPAFLGYGLELISALILEICGGKASDIAKAGEPPAALRHIDFDTARTATLGGAEISNEEQKAILTRLGFAVDARWRVTVPSWRRDIHGTADLVEEIIRIHGLDNVPSVPLPRAADDAGGVAKPVATQMQKIERKMRRTAAARGLNEAINWSFLSEKEAAAFGGVTGESGNWVLTNPISEDMKVMRPTLLAGLLSATRRNTDRGASSVRLFELGRRYFKAADGSSDERLTLGLVLAGNKSLRGWAQGKAVQFDAYDAKAECMALLSAAGVAADNLMVMEHDDSGQSGQGAHYHPGQSATLRMGPKIVLASFGALHPATAKVFDLDGPVMAAEIYLDAIPVKKGGSGFMRAAYTPPALQAVTRDFAFLVPAQLPAGDLIRAVKGCDKTNITAVRLFDRFDGAGVLEGHVSLAIEVTLQPRDKSYTDDDLKSVSNAVIAAAGKVGAALRG
jgi:phenylalanyl-tRNA synthetase beta chain